MIPLLDLVAQYNSIQLEIDAAIKNVLTSGKFILGPNEQAFEHEVAAYLGVKHAIGVASGTDALIIALRAVGIGPGDEVIVPAYSFFATAGAVLSVGAKPVFVDIDPFTYLMNFSQIENVLTAHSKAIIAVHLYGQPADMDEIKALAIRYGLKIIEDNAQAFGAEYKGCKTGALGDLGCLSFFPSKNLGGYGDGGMVTTNDDFLAGQVRKLRTHGWKEKYFPEMLGYNSRLDELQAAVLRVKLKYVDGWNNRRNELGHYYNAKFQEIGVTVPLEACHRTHVYHLYIIRVHHRAEFQRQLKDLGVGSEIYYPQPLHLSMPCRVLGWQEGSFPISENASRETLALPIYPELSPEQIASVISAVKNALYYGGVTM